MNFVLQNQSQKSFFAGLVVVGISFFNCFAYAQQSNGHELEIGPAQKNIYYKIVSENDGVNARLIGSALMDFNAADSALAKNMILQNLENDLRGLKDARPGQYVVDITAPIAGTALGAASAAVASPSVIGAPVAGAVGYQVGEASVRYIADQTILKESAPAVDWTKGPGVDLQDQMLLANALLQSGPEMDKFSLRFNSILAHLKLPAASSGIVIPGAKELFANSQKMVGKVAPELKPASAGLDKQSKNDAASRSSINFTKGLLGVDTDLSKKAEALNPDTKSDESAFTLEEAKLAAVFLSQMFSILKVDPEIQRAFDYSWQGGLKILDTADKFAKHEIGAMAFANGTMAGISILAKLSGGDSSDLILGQLNVMSQLLKQINEQVYRLQLSVYQLTSLITEEFSKVHHSLHSLNGLVKRIDSKINRIQKSINEQALSLKLTASAKNQLDLEQVRLDCLKNYAQVEGNKAKVERCRERFREQIQNARMPHRYLLENETILADLIQSPIGSGSSSPISVQNYLQAEILKNDPVADKDEHESAYTSRKTFLKDSGVDPEFLYAATKAYFDFLWKSYQQFPEPNENLNFALESLERLRVSTEHGLANRDMYLKYLDAYLKAVEVYRQRTTGEFSRLLKDSTYVPISQAPNSAPLYSFLRGMTMGSPDPSRTLRSKSLGMLIPPEFQMAARLNMGELVLAQEILGFRRGGLKQETKCKRHNRSKEGDGGCAEWGSQLVNDWEDDNYIELAVLIFFKMNDGTVFSAPAVKIETTVPIGATKNQIEWQGPIGGAGSWYANLNAHIDSNFRVTGSFHLTKESGLPALTGAHLYFPYTASKQVLPIQCLRPLRLHPLNPQSLNSVEMEYFNFQNASCDEFTEDVNMKALRQSIMDQLLSADQFAAVVHEAKVNLKSTFSALERYHEVLSYHENQTLDCEEKLYAIRPSTIENSLSVIGTAWYENLLNYNRLIERIKNAIAPVFPSPSGARMRLNCLPKKVHVKSKHLNLEVAIKNIKWIQQQCAPLSESLWMRLKPGQKSLKEFCKLN